MRPRPTAGVKAWIRLVFLLLAVVGTSAVGAQPPVAFDWFHYEGRDPALLQPIRDDEFWNPIIPGFHPDPSIVGVDGDYYLVTSSFAYFPGLPVFHSRDLVNWRLLGHALDRRSQLTLENDRGISRGIFAPTIRYYDGRYYIITTDVDGIGNFYITAEDPAGPWSDPVRLPEIDGIDPDIFFDDDGRVWIAHNGPPEGLPLYEGHRAIWLWQFDLARKKLVAGSGRVIVNGGVDISTQPIWIEAPHIYRIGEWYYLSCAEGGTAQDHSQVVFRTRDLEGDFVPYKQNPILSQRNLDPGRRHAVTSTGHADWVQTPGGDWWSVFLGVRPYAWHYHNTGRETFLLPLRWQNGWPVILDPGLPVPRRVKRPELSTEGGVASPQTGNFSWRDEFDGERLRPEWVRLRTSPREWFRLEPADSRVLIQPLPLTLRDRSQPAFLARRQQHLQFSASTRLVPPSDPSVSAGLAAFQSSDFHYFLGVRSAESGLVVFLEQVVDGAPRVLTSREFPTQANAVVLGIEQQGDRLGFHFGDSLEHRTWLARDIDARTLSTEVAGGFVGTTIGIHARKQATEKAGG